MERSSGTRLLGGLLLLVAASAAGCVGESSNDADVASSDDALSTDRNDHPLSLRAGFGVSESYRSLPYEGARPTRVRFVQTSEPKQSVSLHVGVTFRLNRHAPTEDFVELKTDPFIELRPIEQPSLFTIRLVNFSDQPVTGFVHMELIEEDPPPPVAAPPDVPGAGG